MTGARREGSRPPRTTGTRPARGIAADFWTAPRPLLGLRRAFRMSAIRTRGWGVWYVAAVALLAALSALDPQGLRKHLRLEEQVRGMAEENERLAEENAGLAREARALRTDPAELEHAVREELRFVRPGEIVLRLDADRGGVP